MLNYVQLRYKGDAAVATAELVMAAFDVLTAAVISRTSADRTFIIRSFLANKLPSLMGLIAATSFVPIDHEVIVQQVLGRLDPSIYPSFSGGFGLDSTSGANASLSKTEFVLSCALYGFFSDSSIERILGETPMQMSLPRPRLDRHTLVMECKGDLHKLGVLIEGTESMDGNSVVRVEALTDVSLLCWSSQPP